MSGNAAAAVYLDATNNSLEDIDIVGSSTQQDGILIGSQEFAHANVLMNVRGSELMNVIHISKQTSGGSNCPVASGTPNNVCDVTILGVTGSSVTHTIDDELTNTTLTDANVGMYIVGEQVETGTSNGYSRFTTSPSLPTWLVGTGTPPSNGLPCTAGDLYSDTAAGTHTTLFGCKGGSNGWTPIQ